MDGSIGMLREFLGGPKDGMVVKVPADATCFYMAETNLLSFGNALGCEKWCHIYEPDGEGHLIHMLPPVCRLTELEKAQVVEAFSK